MRRKMGLLLVWGAMAFMGCSGAGGSHPVNLESATMPVADADNWGSAAYKRTAALMEEETQLQAEKEPFEKVIAYLAKDGQVSIAVNWVAAQGGGHRSGYTGFGSSGARDAHPNSDGGSQRCRRGKCEFGLHH